MGLPRTCRTCYASVRHRRQKLHEIYSRYCATLGSYRDDAAVEFQEYRTGPRLVAAVIRSKVTAADVVVVAATRYPNTNNLAYPIWFGLTAFDDLRH